ncbi:TonB-dependent receptor [Nitrospirillum iridis]|uniref:Outer membrane receptor protein involved in Fe transport n=1 Tax=Nitrospirillum iridis TaxID=765888 RepID=A0A7X0EDV0_9PROT|nr:TonB-dependent receptor [Nitrospirillum iridis]MBB6253182.1 outer membrane receptor protein involved in Fe transport [Nitrospirillum iridis]
MSECHPRTNPSLVQRAGLAFLILSCAPGALVVGSATAWAQSQPAADADGLTEIIVTAQRRGESISKVPLSVASLSQQQMDQQGIRKIDDIARVTPALRFVPASGVTSNNGSNIYIRGLSSDVGSATTAIYIDDTPIQIRNVGYYGGNPYPKVFDLERVEVLRGPQGTLFGASAEGGAVRFITPQPSFDKLEIYSRAEVASTENGAASYEVGSAVGGPISNTLAVRASAWYQHSGGYIDQVKPGTNTVINKDINSSDTREARLSAAWKPIEGLTVTPSIYYQEEKSRARNDYWEGYGNASNGDYKSGVAMLEPSKDRFTMPALAVKYELEDNIEIISNTSYFQRQQDQTLNYATYFSFLRTGNPFGTYSNKDISNTNDYLTLNQRNLTQELRAQSYDNKYLDWTAGAYYSRTRQYFTNYTGSGRIPGVLVSGYPQYESRYSYVNLVAANDHQYAGYGSVDIKPIEDLKITLAARYTLDEFTFTDTKDGPTNAGVRTVKTVGATEGSWTPKVGVSYQLDPDHMLYASATEGFRPGGAQAAVASEFCAGDLKTLGLTSSPTGYESDHLWSYEGGSKNKLFGGMVSLDASGYLLKWKNIQQSIRLPTCSFSYISNLGAATGKGLELSAAVRPLHGLTFGTEIGYTHITYDENIYGGNNLLLRAEGQRIGGPLWSGHVYGEGEIPVTEAITGYLRADYSFASKNIQQATQGTYGYDSGLYALGATNYLSLRAGARFSGLDLSLFIDNVTNSNDVLSRNHDGVGGTLYYDQSYRPRTFGLTAQYRY